MTEIVQKDEPVLRKLALPVPEKLFGTSELSAIVDRMKRALDAEADGVALAAPQIGVSYRIFIVRYDRTVAAPVPTETDPKPALPPADVGVYINPEFVRRSRRAVEMDEGCLSVRDVYGKTKRHERATVRARREGGSAFERGAGGLLAQIFEHETDHLNGILFTDHARDIVAVPRAVQKQKDAPTSAVDARENDTTASSADVL